MAECETPDHHRQLVSQTWPAVQSCRHMQQSCAAKLQCQQESWADESGAVHDLKACPKTHTKFALHQPHCLTSKKQANVSDCHQHKQLSHGGAHDEVASSLACAPGWQASASMPSCEKRWSSSNAVMMFMSLVWAIQHTHIAALGLPADRIVICWASRIGADHSWCNNYLYIITTPAAADGGKSRTQISIVSNHSPEHIHQQVYCPAVFLLCPQQPSNTVRMK